MRSIRLQSIVCRTARKLSGYLRRRALVRFQTRRGFPIRPSPDSRESGSFSPVVTPLRSSFACPPGRSSRSCPHCQGFVPLRGTTEGIHSRGYSQLPATVRPRVFSTSRRLSPPSDLRACCIPQPRPGFSPFRGFSRPAAVPARRRCVPHCRYRPIAHRHAGCHDRTTRLRGLAPRGEAFLGVGV